ncbi:N-acetylmuramoyl-L-alanine amidase [Paenibacillus alvei]|uniref:N-acetylmuramoyl-L-alanine amidase n=1 Tax=Paenibacillus alvei TaxID=44250 RepID=UPI0018CD6216|nr:N-acetylmuramoyl-L-alanine amidase [Paenibacillus alvei]MBG9737079.1 N-acetylmuramoyl-L-alanine amidase [Paenibacillus alvei]MBG9742811.1 N-acetylmuramoyl-L-alanine amidase [Paenibacillus alvei]MBG9746172.1 N-acetylmuramoyl-L-alanine amidase [Paenibacillus alvei]MCY9579720.1 N-acetylmuramoyl-L-alanine amidase [Paenibacillus alvei]MCY9586373.1 N-acetylmuramoyl-L-alanine amidase [Paenibacillus alvei]
MINEIKQRLLPDGRSNKPGKGMDPQWLTVHNTDNESAGATAEAHSRFILNGSGGAQKSWHYTVDDKDIFQHLRDTEQGWHAGDGNGMGNSRSIGIEICMYKGIDEQAAWHNAAWLIARLAKKYNIPLQRIVPHKHWTGKNCPSRILPHWSQLLNMIDRELISLDKPQQPKPEPTTNDVTVIVDGKQIKDGILVNNITYAPVRSIAEACGLQVGWNQAQKIVTLTKGARG